MTWYNKILFYVLVSSLIGNGCLALALCQQQRKALDVFSARDQLAMAVPEGALKPVSYVIPPRKPVNH